MTPNESIRCTILGCKNEAAYFCIKCDRWICLASEACFHYHEVIEFSKFIERLQNQ
jgi:hypothetical protein